MKATWYDRQGPAAEVLVCGQLPDPVPGPGEVRVAVRFSAVNPGDTKKRRGWLGSDMPYDRVIPHSDGSGVIDAVGPEVDPRRVGQRVWVFGAQSYRPFGTAAEYAVVPEHLALDLPGDVSDEVAACLGIPGITAHRAVFADGPVAGQVVLVHGVLGAVAGLAAQRAAQGGAHVIGTVRAHADIALVDPRVAPRVIALDTQPAERIRELVPEGVDRVIEVSLSSNLTLDTAVARTGAVIAAYGSRDDRVTLDVWPMLFANLSVRLLGSDDFPAAAKARAARELTGLAARLHIPIAHPYPLSAVAAAHDAVDGGTRERVLIEVGAPDAGGVAHAAAEAGLRQERETP